jgi:hypothetical protein
MKLHFLFVLLKQSSLKKTNNLYLVFQNFFMSRRLIKIYLLLQLCGITLYSCSGGEEKLTKEEAISFAKEIEAAIKKGEGIFLDKAFDKNEFIKKMDLPDQQEAKGFAKGVAEKITIGSQIVNELSDRDNFEFIKHYEKDKRHHLVYRLYMDKDGSLNYQDYELVKTSNKCRVADIYIYMTGETLTETMRNMYTSLYPRSIGEAAVTESEKIADIGKIKEIRKLINTGNATEAKKMYDDLPDYIKQTKTVAVLRVLLSSGLTTEEYTAAITDFRQRFPNEPGMHLMMIDGYYLQKDYTGMLGAINSLDSQINKDPLLDYHRYLSYELLGDTTNSMLCLRRLVKNMPDFQKGVIELIAVNLKYNNKMEADALIALYRKKTIFDQAKLDNIISYYQ